MDTIGPRPWQLPTRRIPTLALPTSGRVGHTPLSALLQSSPAHLFHLYVRVYHNRKRNATGIELGLSRSTVKRALDGLCRARLIIKEDRWRENGSLTSNLYRLL